MIQIRLPLKCKKGMASMVEVLVSAIIFTIAVAGILSTTSSLSPEGSESSQKVKAANAAKSVLNDLRTQVDAAIAGGDGYFGPNLTLGDHSVVRDGYTVNYTVTAPTPELRQVTATVTW